MWKFKFILLGIFLVSILLINTVSADVDPSPQITVDSYPSCITLGQKATITISGENNGGNSPEAYFSVSFPDNPSYVRIVSSNAPNSKVYSKGVTLWGGYGQYQLTAKYAIAEGWAVPWQGDDEYYLTVEVTPEKIGDFNFYIKMTAKDNDADRWLSDPISWMSDAKDQQNEYVEFYIIKVQQRCVAAVGDSGPKVEWDKTFGGRTGASSVRQTADGGLIMAGGTARSSKRTGALLIKTDSNGNEQWSKTFGGADLDGADSVQQTLDGGYIIAGFTGMTAYVDESKEAGAWLIKTDSTGNLQFNRIFGDKSSSYFAHSVQQTSDGGYIIAGETNYGAGLIKTDSYGNKQWNKTFDGEIASAKSVQQTSDGGYILTGYITEPIPFLIIPSIF